MSYPYILVWWLYDNSLLYVYRAPNHDLVVPDDGLLVGPAGRPCWEAWRAWFSFFHHILISLRDTTGGETDSDLKPLPAKKLFYFCRYPRPLMLNAHICWNFVNIFFLLSTKRRLTSFLFFYSALTNIVIILWLKAFKPPNLDLFALLQYLVTFKSYKKGTFDIFNSAETLDNSNNNI